MSVTKEWSVIEPTRWVFSEGRMSIPKGLKPRVGRDNINAVPRWPDEPVTRTL